MANTTKIVLMIVIGFAVLVAAGAGFYMLGKGLNNTNTSNSEQTQLEAIETPPPTVGYFEGELSYPSEGIPDELTVCAETLEGQQVACTAQHLIAEQGNPKYRLEIPPGNYYVYAYLPSNPSAKAYYSEFVTCGLEASCPSHEPIEVPILAGETAMEINPGDWYAPPQPQL